MGELQSACLLEEGDDPESQVRMHDVIHDLALWIASEEGQSRSMTGPKEMADVGKWAKAERISMVKANGAFVVVEIEAPTCPALLTLMPDGFFNSMSVLRVLDLSNTHISMLPTGIDLLGELQYLNLSGIGIHSLPDNLGELKKLILLDLSHTSHLRSIPSKVVLRLTRLQKFFPHDNTLAQALTPVDSCSPHVLALLPLLRVVTHTLLPLRWPCTFARRRLRRPAICSLPCRAVLLTTPARQLKHLSV
ncbi:hypothetical protein Taro_024977 [Colocasia esculenta]|uniref:Disease resistance R13L4/SHOC-2-like LRR domain-containing protein n=1 Tax=Colocasia esculenta TaxID=4460 RepID=A0A843V8Y5_COLES|nr:hypothetical protein [Colocasia esculenta]